MATDRFSLARGAERFASNYSAAIEQALYSVTNLIALTTAAHLLSIDGFAAMSFGVTVAQFALGLIRTGVGETLLLHGDRASGMYRVLVSVCVPVAVAVAIIGAVVPYATVSDAILTTAACIPVLCLYEMQRFAALRTRLPVAAMAALLWLAVALVPWIVPGFSSWVPRTSVFMLCWWTAGSIPGILWMTWRSPRAERTIADGSLRRHWKANDWHALRAVSDFVIANGFGLMIPAAVLWIGGSATLATFRAGELVLGPVRFLLAAAAAIHIDLAARMGAKAALASWYRVTLISTIAWGGLLSVWPWLGFVLTGEGWDLIDSTVWIWIVGWAVYGQCSVVPIALRVAGRGRGSIQTRVIIGIGSVLLLAVAASAASARTLAVAFLIVQVGSLVAWRWLAHIRLAGGGEPSTRTVDVDGPDRVAEE